MNTIGKKIYISIVFFILLLLLGNCSEKNSTYLNSNSEEREGGKGNNSQETDRKSLFEKEDFHNKSLSDILENPPLEITILPIANSNYWGRIKYYPDGTEKIGYEGQAEITILKKNFLNPNTLEITYNLTFIEDDEVQISITIERQLIVDAIEVAISQEHSKAIIEIDAEMH